MISPAVRPDQKAGVLLRCRHRFRVLLLELAELLRFTAGSGSGEIPIARLHGGSEIENSDSSICAEEVQAEAGNDSSAPPANRKRHAGL